VPVPGMVCLLRGSPDVMHTRTLGRHKGATKQYVALLRWKFDLLWREPRDGIVEIDATDLTERDMVRSIARLVHLGAYRTVNLAERARPVAEGKL
jgi:hypothetical protein